jgi:hypothetical protein
MKKAKAFVILSAVMLAGLSAAAQGSFQNLDFESASLAPTSGFGGNVPIGSALPGWSATIGGVAVTQVLQNNYTLGEAFIDILGPGWNYINPGIIDGNYTVYLQAFDSTQGNVSIWQSGTIPANALSLQFKTWKFQPTSAFSVTFNGNSLSPVVLSSGQSASGQTYDVYGANIGAYAGQTGSLEFTALVSGYGESATEFDDITFSPTSVPEPNTLAIIVMGGVAVAARRCGKGLIKT